MTFVSNARQRIKCQSIDNLCNGAKINPYFDQSFSFRKTKLLLMRKRFWRSNGLQNQKNLSIKNHFLLFFHFRSQNFMKND